MENYKNIIEDKTKGEQKILDADKELRELIEKQHEIEVKIKELKEQEIHDDNGTSTEMEIINKKEELEGVKNKIQDILEKDTNDKKDSLIDHVNDFQN